MALLTYTCSYYSNGSEQRKSHSSQQRKIRHVHGGVGKADGQFLSPVNSYHSIELEVRFELLKA